MDHPEHENNDRELLDGLRKVREHDHHRALRRLLAFLERWASDRP